MASEHPLDFAIAELERLVDADFRESRCPALRPGFRAERNAHGDLVFYQHWWESPRAREGVRALRSYIAAIRVLRRERDDDMEDARLTAGVFLSRGQPLSPETAARWTRTQRREARMWVTGALSRAPRHVAPADLGGDRGE